MSSTPVIHERFMNASRIIPPRVGVGVGVGEVSHPSIVSTGSNPTGLWITLGGFVPMMDGGYAAMVGGAW